MEGRGGNLKVFSQEIKRNHSGQVCHLEKLFFRFMRVLKGLKKEKYTKAPRQPLSLELGPTG